MELPYTRFAGVVIAKDIAMKNTTKKSTKVITGGDVYKKAADRIDAIEAEMRRIGRWQNQRPKEEAFQSGSAFFMDTMPFSTWLTFVFIPRVRNIIAERGEFPASSQVGVQALREFDGCPEAGELVHLMSQFDSFIVATAGMRGPIGLEKLENAAADGKAGRVRELLDAGVKPSTTALTWSASKGNLDTVRYLLDAGVACDARDCYGVTAVFFAAGAGNGEICPFLINPDDAPPGKYEKTHIVPGHTEILRLLIDRGAPFDKPFVAEPPYQSAGATPLIVAAAFGHEAAVLELCKRGARVKALDREGRSAAYWAERAGRRKIAKILQDLELKE